MYIYKMKRQINYIIIIILSLYGCSYPFDDIVKNNTKVILVFEQNNFEIKIWLQDQSDIEISSISPDNLINATKLVYNMTGIESLKSIMIYLPHDQSIWEGLFDSSNGLTAWGFYQSVTKLDDFFIAFAPDKWSSGSQEELIYVYLHELTHHVIERFEGNSDNEHQRPEYWGKDGLFECIFNKWITLAK